MTYVELFFDLVFVFAVTQLSHFLLQHFSLSGVLQATLLLMAVWWVWIYTSWVTNWLDPQTTPVRIMLFVLMPAGLVLSTSLPEAFNSKGMAFAGAYVFMQVGRSLFMIWALRRHQPNNYRNFIRIALWSAAAGIFWIIGAFLEGEQRLVVWAIGLAVEYVSPSLGFRVPGLGKSATTDWDVEGAHMAERCALFIIISLGESILVTGATFASLPASFATIAAFLSAFTGSVAMWWIYFNIGAERASQAIAASKDPGQIARVAYTYTHLLPVAGIIVSAVADELVLGHPHGAVDLKTAMSSIGGPALFLAGNILFKRIAIGKSAPSHMVGLILLALLCLLAPGLTPLSLSLATTGVMVMVAVWETLSVPSPRRTAAESRTAPPHGKRKAVVSSSAARRMKS